MIIIFFDISTFIYHSIHQWINSRKYIRIVFGLSYMHVFKSVFNLEYYYQYHYSKQYKKKHDYINTDLVRRVILMLVYV